MLHARSVTANTLFTLVLVLGSDLGSCQSSEPPAATSPTLRQHDGAVVFVAYTPDGKHILTSIYEGAIRKWDAASGKELQLIEKAIKLDGSTPDVRCRAAALSPDGKYLGVLSYASTLNIYTVATGKAYGQIVTGEDQLSGAFAVAFAADGKSVATSRFQGRAVTQWDLIKGKPIQKFGDDTKPKGVVLAGRSALAFGDKVLASETVELKNGQAAGVSVRRWNLETGKELSPAQGPVGGTNSVVFASDGKTAAWGNAGAGTIWLWDLAADKELKKLEGTGHARVFSTDGKFLAGRDTDRVVCVWDTARGKVLRKYGDKPVNLPLNARADVLAFSADGKKLVAGLGPEVRQWDVASGMEIGQLGNPK